jgi:hypothetical protein
MIELGIIKGIVPKTHFEIWESAKKKFQQKRALERVIKSAQTKVWINATPLPHPELTRSQSYYEHLAGIYFPPDLHDNEGNLRAQALALLSATKNFDPDYHWKMNRRENFNGESDPNLDFGSRDEVEDVKSTVRIYQHPKVNDSRQKSAATLSRPRTAVNSRSIKSGAQVALSMGRVMSASTRSRKATTATRPSTSKTLYCTLRPIPLI